MKGLEIVNYEENMLDDMRRLFYETVHTVNARHYRKEQLNCWAPRNPDTRFWQERLRKNICKVAFIDGVMVGFTELVDDGHVEALYVHKDFQRRKIAANLIDQILQIANEKNYNILTTEASITAKPFFEAFGFRVTGIKRKLHNGKDFKNYKMAKEL